MCCMRYLLATAYSRPGVRHEVPSNNRDTRNSGLDEECLLASHCAQVCVRGGMVNVEPMHAHKFVYLTLGADAPSLVSLVADARDCFDFLRSRQRLPTLENRQPLDNFTSPSSAFPITPTTIASKHSHRRNTHT